MHEHGLLRAFLDMVQIATKGLNAQEEFNSFAAKLKEVIPFDEVSINLIEADRQSYQVWAIYSTTNAAVKPGQIMTLKGSGTEWVISMSQPHIEKDIVRKRQFTTDDDLVRQGYRSILRVPLCFSGKPFGTFNLRNCQPGVYGERHLRVVKQLCEVIDEIIWYQRGAALEDRLLAELERQDKDRTEFVALLAHELKTPLTPVLASSRLLVEQFHPEPGSLQERLITSIIRGAEALEARLSDFLDLTQLQAGAFSLQKRSMDPVSLLDDVAQQFQPVAAIKRQNLTLDLPKRLPRVKADRRRITQVLVNLLENAVKFTPEGGSILLKAVIRDRELVIEVHNSGYGLSIDEQRRLFRPYCRSEVDKQRVPGSGLGLFLCKRLVESHGGKMRVVCVPGKGNTFAFALPLGGPTVKATRGK